MKVAQKLKEEEESMLEETKALSERLKQLTEQNRVINREISNIRKRELQLQEKYQLLKRLKEDKKK
jgi:hypothetical protein